MVSANNLKMISNIKLLVMAILPNVTDHFTPILKPVRINIETNPLSSSGPVPAMFRIERSYSLLYEKNCLLADG